MPHESRRFAFAGLFQNWPKRIILDDCYPNTGPLMVRYFLIRTRWFALYLHHFLRSDNDRHVHDHPWSFITVLLSGGYWEHLPDGREYWRKRFSIHFRPAEWQHWVEIEKPVWTLVLRFRRRRQWGFVTSAGWINHVAYGIQWCEDATPQKQTVLKGGETPVPRQDEKTTRMITVHIAAAPMEKEQRCLRCYQKLLDIDPVTGNVFQPAAYVAEFEDGGKLLRAQDAYGPDERQCRRRWSPGKTA